MNIPVSNSNHLTARYEEIADAVCERLANDKPVRRNLPGEGRLRIDRQLPFLCVYRKPDEPDPGTRDLVTTEAAYMFASGDHAHVEGIRKLCGRVSSSMQEHFGRFLVLELWASPEKEHSGKPAYLPVFEIVSDGENTYEDAVAVFKQALLDVSVNRFQPRVTVRHSSPVAPREMKPIFPGPKDSDYISIGLEIRPIYRDSEFDTLFPILLTSLRRQLARAIRKGIAGFSGLDSTSGKWHYETLGPTSMVKAARLADQQLCEISQSYDFVLQVTPTNSDSAWEEFRNGGFAEQPVFYYRPLPYSPNLLKRRLFEIQIERIEDPTLGDLLWEKQEEIDRQLSALRDMETPGFIYASMQIFGKADNEITQLANEILKKYPAPQKHSGKSTCVDADELISAARKEIDYYHRRISAFTATVEKCDHIAAGLMVSRDRLLIADSVQISKNRLKPLLHHEIGTHLLTYFNGRAQPFQQLYAGLAGYEELQEGLAVLAEYLTGGLTVNRLRSLAGRVIAVRAVSDGLSFSEAFALLHEQHGFAMYRAFNTTLRAYRGGGLTKDVIYLRGLRDLLMYLQQGHDIDPLYVGKIGLQHVLKIQEMRRRGVIAAPAVLPRFWDEEGIREKLDSCRNCTVLDLLELNP